MKGNGISLILRMNFIETGDELHYLLTCDYFQSERKRFSKVCVCVCVYVCVRVCVRACVCVCVHVCV